MSNENNGLTTSTNSLNSPSAESRSNYRGSNEFMITDKTKKSTSEQLKSIGSWGKAKAKNVFRKKTLYKRIPILNWLPKYTSEDAIGDAVAGITVGLTVIPQALAYAGIAGLPAAYGLYSSFLGCFVYIFLGSCKDIPMGPTAISALLILRAANGVWQRAVLLSFTTGIIQLLMGVFGLGFLVEFVSGPVSSGFTSAVALIVFTSQVKDIFGIQAAGTTFLKTWIAVFEDIHNIRVGDTVMGLICIIVLLLMRQLASYQIGPKEDKLKSSTQKWVNKLFWLIGTSRNAIVVIVCGGIAAAVYNPDEEGEGHFKLIREIPPGLPSFQLPPFSIPETVVNGTITQEAESFGDMISSLGSGIIVLPLIGLLENVSICKAFAKGKSVDATQELIATGASNIANSFVQGFPSSGALSRAAVNNSSGVRTPGGGLYTGILVILSLLFLTPLFFYIPKAALGGVLIAAVIFMVEYQVIKPIWRSKKTDLIPAIATLIGCLVIPMEYGILLGIGLNVLFILYHSARPKIEIEELQTGCGTKYIIITPDRCLFFPSVDFVRNLINKQGLITQMPVVIDCSHIYGADFTAAKIIESLIQDFNSRNQMLLFYNLKPSVVSVFDGGKPSDLQVFYEFDSLEREITEKV